MITGMSQTHSQLILSRYFVSPGGTILFVQMAGCTQFYAGLVNSNTMTDKNLYFHKWPLHSYARVACENSYFHPKLCDVTIGTLPTFSNVNVLGIIQAGNQCTDGTTLWFSILKSWTMGALSYCTIVLYTLSYDFRSCAFPKKNLQKL